MKQLMQNKLKLIIPFTILVVIFIVELVIIFGSKSKELKINTNTQSNIKNTSEKAEEETNLGDATIYFNSANVNYNNSNSGLTSNRVQNAVDELYGLAYNMPIYKDEICPGCVYRKSTTTKYNSNSSGANGTNNKLSSSEYTTDYTTLNSNYFLGHVIDSNGYILSSYACGINNGTFFCLRGVDSDQTSLTYKPFYQEGVNIMNKAFPGCNANTSGSDAGCTDGVRAEVYSDGYVRVRTNFGCYVGDGNSECT